MVQGEAEQRAKRTRRGQSSHERRKKAKKDAYQGSFQTHWDVNDHEQDEAANTTTRKWWTWSQQHNEHVSSDVRTGWQDMCHSAQTDQGDAWQQHALTGGPSAGDRVVAMVGIGDGYSDDDAGASDVRNHPYVMMRKPYGMVRNHARRTPTKESKE